MEDGFGSLGDTLENIKKWISIQNKHLILLFPKLGEVVLT